MLATKDMVSKLIPQQAPMVMVDELLYHDDQKSRSSLHIENDNLFVEEGLLSEAGIIENIAQTAALRTGWKALQTAKGGEVKNPPVGVIGAVKNFLLYRQPKANTDIITEVNVQTEIFNATMISGKVMAGEDLLAECEMKIFLQE